MGRFFLPALLVLASGGPGQARASPRAAPLVVIDPGHGGSAVGAPGLHGLHEKEVTLAIARLLERRLAAQGIGVALTRTRDAYLTLGERVRRANQSGARLFVSIHANATADHRRRGVETYVAAPDVVDVAAERAARESSDLPGAVARAEVRRVAADSVRLARAIQGRLVETRRGDRGVRQAPYDVLDGVRLPAVLVEVGFIDHPEEGEELGRVAAQARIAQALAAGILDFARHRPPLVATAPGHASSDR